MFISINLGFCFVVSKKTLNCSFCPYGEIYPLCFVGRKYDITYPSGPLYLFPNDIKPLLDFLNSPLDVLAEAIFGNSCGDDNKEVIELLEKYLAMVEHSKVDRHVIVFNVFWSLCNDN